MGGRRRRGFYGLGADGEKEKFACLWKFSNALEELSRVAYEGGLSDLQQPAGRTESQRRRK